MIAWRALLERHLADGVEPGRAIARVLRDLRARALASTR